MSPAAQRQIPLHQMRGTAKRPPSRQGVGRSISVLLFELACGGDFLSAGRVGLVSMAGLARHPKKNCTPYFGGAMLAANTSHELLKRVSLKLLRSPENSV